MGIDLSGFLCVCVPPPPPPPPRALRKSGRMRLIFTRPLLVWQYLRSWLLSRYTLIKHLFSEFGVILKGFLFSTYAGVYAGLATPIHLIFMLSACSVLGACFVVAKCHKRPCLITSFYSIATGIINGSVSITIYSSGV